ncbi:hypothetical protein D9M70_536120 [compost metagenome]
MVGDHRGEQADVVGVLAVAGADLALPLRIGKFFIGDVVLGDAVLGSVDDAAARGEAEPVAVRIAEMCRDVLADRLVDDRLGDACVLGFGQAADVDRQDHVGRRVGAFGLDALDEALVEEEHVGGDAGFLGEGVEQRLDQIGLPVGIDIDLTVGPGGARRKQGCRQGQNAHRCS